MNQRPTEFGDAVNRLKAEGGYADNHVSAYLNDSWNIVGPAPSAVPPVVRWITSLSGWPDPFESGVDRLHEWVPMAPVSSGSLKVQGLPAGQTVATRVEAFKAALRESLLSVNSSFNLFALNQRLTWMGPWPGAEVPDEPFGSHLAPLAPDALAIANAMTLDFDDGLG